MQTNAKTLEVLLFGVRGVGRNGVASQGSRNSERSPRNLQ